MKCRIIRTSLQQLVLAYKYDTYTADHIRIYSQMRLFVGKSSRGKRRERILAKKLGQLYNHPIMEQLFYVDGEVCFISEGDYSKEMATLRDIFDE